jgi:hypothetical protein
MTRLIFSHGPCGRRAAPGQVRRLLYIATALVLPVADASPADDGLFATTDQNPFIQVYSLPSPALYAAPGHGRWSWRFQFDLANGAIEEQLASGARVTLDGETYRSIFALSHGLSDRLTAGLTVPYVAHSGGFLDSFVRSWHDTFGLTNSRRDDFEDELLDYGYAEGTVDQFRITGRSRGIGDVRLTLDWHLGGSGPRRQLALRGGLKLPTGSSEHLHGSGSTDVSMQLLGTDGATLAAWDTTLAWMVGGLWLGDGEVLDGLQRDLVALGSIGVSRPLWRSLAVRLQLDGHTSFYDTDLRPLGSSGVQLTFGGSIALANGSRIDIAMIENLFTDTTPDLVFHLAWRGAL